MNNTPIRFDAVTTPAQIETTATLASTIWHECFASILSPQQIDYMVENIQSAPAMARQTQTEGYEYFLLTFNGDDAPGGYIAIQAKNNQLLLSKLYILAIHRGKGYARQIITAAEEMGRQRGCQTLWLTVNRYNQRAIDTYRKTGFTLAREQVADIGGGFVMDDFVFEKPL